MTVSVADFTEQTVHGCGRFFEPRVARAQVATRHPEIHVPNPIERELHVPRKLEHVSGDRSTEAVHRAIREMPDAGAPLGLPKREPKRLNGPGGTFVVRPVPTLTTWRIEDPRAREAIMITPFPRHE